MNHQVLCKKFGLYYGGYTLIVYVLQAIVGSNPLETLDAFIIFGFTFYLVKDFSDRNRRSFSSEEQKQIMAMFGAIVFVARAILLVPTVNGLGPAIMTALLTSFLQIAVVAIAIVSVRAYGALMRP